MAADITKLEARENAFTAEALWDLSNTRVYYNDALKVACRCMAEDLWLLKDLPSGLIEIVHIDQIFAEEWHRS